jgi:predicted metal-binding protein
VAHEAAELDRYCQEAISRGAAHALVITPDLVATAPWVQWKCRFGCPDYGKWYCCPPYVPTDQETRRVLDSYHRLILLHFQYCFNSRKGPAGGDEYQKFRRDVDYVKNMERTLFLDGFYRAFALPHEPCQACDPCPPVAGKPCKFPEKARPAMESVGIDVYQTARSNDLPMQMMTGESDVCNCYALILVD